MRAAAKVTSKGQITVPIKVRETLGLVAGDKVVFACRGKGIHLIRKEGEESPFAKYQGIGNPGIGSSREEINHYIRELRGHDERRTIL